MLRLLGLAVALVMAQPASAVVMKMQFEGSVASGLGEFGAPQSDLTGKPFTATFLYSTVISRHTFKYQDFVSGGPDSPFASVFGYQSPVIAAYVIINGTQLDLKTSGDSQIVTRDNPAPWMESISGFIHWDRPGDYEYLSLFVQTNPSAPNRLDQEFTGQVTSYVGNVNYLTAFNTQIRLNPIRVDVSLTDIPDPAIEPPPPIIGGVPEPSSWAFMIVGFGIVGAALRLPVTRGRNELSADRS